nr:hypothetical protein [Tanacetum cinerariifolium]
MKELIHEANSVNTRALE